MFILWVLFILLGLIAGSITGLTPGIHTNTLALILLSMYSYLRLNLGLSPLLISSIMISMVTSHLFFDFLPSIFLGVPDEETALTILPAHRLLLRGQGFSALLRSVSSSLISLLIGFVGLPFLIFIFPLLFSISKHINLLVLLSISLMIIVNHKGKSKRFWAFFIFLISGVIGLMTLNMPFLKEPLLPLFSGLFGLSLVIKSLTSDSRIPEQGEVNEIYINIENSIKGFIAGFLTALFPAISSSQAASIFKNKKNEDFIEKLAGVNASNLFLTLVAAVTIKKFRSGTLIVISRIISLNLKTGLILIVVILISAGISVFLSIKTARRLVNIIERIKYKQLNTIIIVLIVGLTLWISKFLGLIVLFVSTALGLLSQQLGVRKSSCMGSLILPIMIYYLI